LTSSQGKLGVKNQEISVFYGNIVQNQAKNKDFALNLPG
jgi:hypothetical protein